MRPGVGTHTIDELDTSEEESEQLVSSFHSLHKTLHAARRANGAIIMYDALIEKMCATFNTDQYLFTCEKTGNDEVTFTWDRQNAQIVGLGSVEDRHMTFKHIVTLLPGNKYKTHDGDESKTKSVSLSSGGSLSFGAGTESFKGHKSGFQKEITFGRNKNTGETGLIEFDFNSKRIKGPVKQFLAENGMKKGLF